MVCQSTCAVPEALVLSNGTGCWKMDPSLLRRSSAPVSKSPSCFVWFMSQVVGSSLTIRHGSQDHQRCRGTHRVAGSSRFPTRVIHTCATFKPKIHPQMSDASLCPATPSELKYHLLRETFPHTLFQSETTGVRGWNLPLYPSLQSLEKRVCR